MVDYLKEKFGAWQISGNENKGTLRFKLFYPDIPNAPTNIKTIQGAGSFQEEIGHPKNWDFENGPHLQATAVPNEGTIWSYTTSQDLSKDFYEYKYYVVFQGSSNETRKISDPFVR